MFTGIIEAKGVLRGRIEDAGNLLLTFASDLASELKIDQSVAHNGICLTVVEVDAKQHTVCVVPETIEKTTVAEWSVGDEVNLERCVLLNARLDGHLVQGHVDTKARCIEREDKEGSWLFTFEFDSANAALVIEKGSITLNGTSLTCFNVGSNTFQVAIIPYTYHHTTINKVKVGDAVNVEFDIIGKYLVRQIDLSKI